MLIKIILSPAVSSEIFGPTCTNCPFQLHHRWPIVRRLQETNAVWRSVACLLPFAGPWSLTSYANQQLTIPLDLRYSTLR